MNFSKAGILYETQVVMPVVYNEIQIESGLRLDIWVERTIIVKLKAVESILPIHEAERHTYLKLSNCRLGLLLNFNTKLLKDGIKRIAI